MRDINTRGGEEGEGGVVRQRPEGSGAKERRRKAKESG
jgi:hypothetical protein